MSLRKVFSCLNGRPVIWKTFQTILSPNTSNPLEGLSARYFSFNPSTLHQKQRNEANDAEHSMIENDEELQAILADITNDFEDPHHPPDGSNGPKNKGRDRVLVNQHKNYEEMNDERPNLAGQRYKPPLIKEDVPKSSSMLFQTKRLEKFDKIKPTPILDASEEEQQEFYLYQEKTQLKSLSSVRGLQGVFDIDQLVELLGQERLRDVTVIALPKEANYCQHLIIATALSIRHLKSVSEFILKAHKAKRIEGDPFLLVEGKESTKWKVLDMGNIILHLFLEESREEMDLETLWAVGYEYDTFLNLKPDPLEELLKEHTIFLDRTHQRNQ